MSDDIGDIYLIAAGEVWINGGGADGAVETIASQLRRNAHMQGVAQSLQSQLAAANERCAELTGLGDKVNAIRNSIIGAQSFNFSEHAYPLVAALNEAGFVGLPYPEAKENLGMLIDQLAAERERADGLQKIVDAARAQNPFAYAYRKRGSLRPYWIYADELPTHDDVIDWRELYAAAPVPAQPSVVPKGLADTVLANIAAIAHCGGLAKLDNENALSNIRQLSKPWCDNTGTLRDLKNRVDAAILSATDTEGRKP